MILKVRMIACFQQRNGEVNRKKWIIHGRNELFRIKKMSLLKCSISRGERARKNSVA